MANSLVLTAHGVLVHEHRGIERVVRTIAKTADKVEGFRFVEPRVLLDVACFLRAFARQCQQEKEEALLYPLLEAKRTSRSRYFFASLAAEHSKAEALSSVLLKSASIYNSSGGARKSLLVCTLRNLVTLYRRHLRKEDELLLPVADEVLSGAEQDTLYRAFGHVAAPVPLDELAAGIEWQSAHAPSHPGEIQI
jgi:hemerythrin-like domain-containing protein